MARPPIQVVSRSTPSRSATTLPIGGICEAGRRERTRATMALSSG
ncbi:MAG: hypothetical protein ABI665_01520 [Vicinamibacterales bacterium]